MDRRDFMKLLASGALMAMVVPSVADAFQSGKMSEEELYNLLKDGGEGIVSQEAVVLRREGRGFVPTGDTVTHHYRVTGKAFGQRSGESCVQAKRTGKFIPGHRVNAEGTPVPEPVRDPFAKYAPGTRPDRSPELVQHWDDKLAKTEREHGPISSNLWPEQI